MKRCLTIDHGNSAVKVHFFIDGKVCALRRVDALSKSVIEELRADFEPCGVMCCSVADNMEAILAALNGWNGRVSALHRNLPLPLTIDYASPATLGYDRIAAAVGAMVVAPRCNCLVVDAGTAMTLDYLTADGRFKGGNIAPGITLRLKALADRCALLPLVGSDGETPIIGYDTSTAIRAGAVIGATLEVEGIARRLNVDKVIVTGGDAALIAANADINVAVEPHLVAFGLNRIFEYNEYL